MVRVDQRHHSLVIAIEGNGGGGKQNDFRFLVHVQERHVDLGIIARLRLQFDAVVFDSVRISKIFGIYV